MNRKKIKFDFWTIITLVIVTVFVIFLIYPLFSLFLSGFKDPTTGDFTLDNFIKFFGKKYYYQAFFNSFSVTTCVAILAILN